jgi:hypothetical protein
MLLRRLYFARLFLGFYSGVVGIAISGRSGNVIYRIVQRGGVFVTKSSDLHYVTSGLNCVPKCVTVFGFSVKKSKRANCLKNADGPELRASFVI